MLTLILGTGMIVSGLTIGAKNIWDAATKKAFKDEQTLSKMVKAQKAQINELIEQNFNIMNSVKKNVDVMVVSTLDLLDDVNKIQENIDNKMKKVNNKVCEFVLSTNSTLDSIHTESGSDTDDIDESSDVKVASNTERGVSGKTNAKNKTKAEELLTNAMVDAGEDEELARVCAEAIRESDKEESGKRYKSAKKGGKK